MPIILDECDRSRFNWTSFCKGIKNVRIYYDRWHGTDRERDHLKRTQIFQMLGRMPAVKEFYFDDSCEKFPAGVYLSLPSIENLSINSQSLEKTIHKTVSLKKLYLNMEPLLNFECFRFNEENVVKLVTKVRDGEEAGVGDITDAKLAALSQMIEQRMPKLKSLDLDFLCIDEWDGLTFVLKSKSLQKADMQPIEIMAGVYCPSLKTLNGEESWKRMLDI